MCVEDVHVEMADGRADLGAGNALLPERTFKC